MVPSFSVLNAAIVAAAMWASLPVIEARSLPKAHIMVLYSGDGALWGIADGLTINKHWQKVLQRKVDTDPTWPFNATLEFYDVHSSNVLTEQYLKWRFENATRGLKPPVTAIMGAEVSTPLIFLQPCHISPSYSFNPTSFFRVLLLCPPCSRAFWAMFVLDMVPSTTSRCSTLC